MRLLALLVLSAAVVAFAGLGGSFLVPLDHEAIGYSTLPVNDPVSRAKSSISSSLYYDAKFGYLASVLAALDVPVESQVLVFSKTSFQAPLIAPHTPRALYFNDNVTVGYVHEGDVIEVTSLDPKQGVIFYTFDQDSGRKPTFERRDTCLQCHQSPATLGIPGLVVRSVTSDPSGQPLFHAGSKITDHRSPLTERWGGWYVTGKATGTHMGNQVAPDRDKPENLEPLGSRYSPLRYLTPHSDVVALMVLEHQTQMINLIVRVGFEIRHALHSQRAMNTIFGDPPDTRSESTQRRIREAARELVDYMLMTEEAALPAPIVGSSGFTEYFSNLAPRDKAGRSLRQLDLRTRLFRYPCSYMVYSAAFDSMPPEALEAVYRELHRRLTADTKLPLADRRAVLEILQATKATLPDYLRTAIVAQ